MPATTRIPLLRDPLLGVYLFLLVGFLLPARLIVGPLGGVGAPATLIALGVAVAYAVARLLPGALADGTQPVRTALLAFAAVTVLGYGVGLARTLLAVEAASMDRALVASVGYIGLALVVADGVRSRAHLDRLLRLLVVGGVLLSAMGILQFVTGLTPDTYLRVPGLQMQDVTVNASRSFLTRVMGTTLHPIEYGVVLAVILPFALHYATTSRDGLRPSRWWWVAAGMIVVGIPMSVSRSSILGIAVGGVILAMAWGWRRRVNLVVAGLLMLVAMRAAFPGLLGTLKSYFFAFGKDPSIEGRTQDYPVAWQYIQERPWLGRGLGTFPPEAYFYLDNEYLNRILTGGVIGLAVLIALLLVAMGTARGVFHHAADQTSRALGQALTASIAVTAFTWFTYDGLAFRLAAGVGFITIGAAGALWRLEVGHRRWGTDVDHTRPEIVLAPRPRRSGDLDHRLDDDPLGVDLAHDRDLDAVAPADRVPVGARSRA